MSEHKGECCREEADLYSVFGEGVRDEDGGGSSGMAGTGGGGEVDGAVSVGALIRDI